MTRSEAEREMTKSYMKNQARHDLEIMIECTSVDGYTIDDILDLITEHIDRIEGEELTKELFIKDYYNFIVALRKRLEEA